MVTRYTVALDAGESFYSYVKTWRDTSLDATSERGREVLVGWRPEQAVAVRGQTNK